MNNSLRTPKPPVAVRRHPIAVQIITWLILATQLLAPYSGRLFVAGNTVQAAEPVSAGTARPEPVLTPTNVVVNRTLPLVQAPPARLAFSDSPTDAEFFHAHVLAGPLVPIGAATTPEENRALAAALLAFTQRGSSDDASALVKFLDEHPQSAWRASLLTYLGIFYRNTGYFTRALDVWERAWALAKHETSGDRGAIADQAVAQLAELNARLGRFERLESLFGEIDGRDIRGSATEKISGAKQGLWLMDNRPADAFRCGPMAVRCIRSSLGLQEPTNPTIEALRSTRQGTSLKQVCDLANALDMRYQMAKRAPGAKVIVPAVVNWKAGHFAALVKELDGAVQVQDPTFGDDIWVSPAALDDEASGYFVVPSGPLPQGWQSVSDAEGQTVFGKGNTGTNDKNANKPCDKKDGCQGASKGMAQFAFHSMLVSLNIMDTPVGYSPPRGPVVQFTVTYNQREANQPASFNYSNLGNKWTFDWLAYITDNPTNGNAPASYYVQGGGTEPYSNFDTNTQSYATQVESRTKLVRTSSTSYERRYQDGSKQLFTLSDGASPARKIFLTGIVDSFGNSISNLYDANFRLVAVQDALGQVTSLTYGSTNLTNSLFYKITQVTDPFGRYATFAYNTNGQLTNITDVVGISSRFAYGTNDFITSLSTPYGTTSFQMGESGTTRWLQATDPYGESERLEFLHGGIAHVEPAVPQGMNLADAWLDYRNSFYWDKKAMREAPGDYTRARITHWLHLDSNTAAGIKESEKEPLENRVWYNYPGQAAGGVFVGTSGLPSAIGRVLDDGTTQLNKFEYNDLGKVTKTIDPLGRTTTFTYSTNLIDLLQVQQMVGTNNEVLGKFTYNTGHLPLTAIDAAGKTNFFGYNSNGQLTALTNALNQTVTMSYDTNGYLTNILGSIAGSTTSFTYDGYGRVRTVKDSEGYTVTNDYDNLDRITRVTYPDTTYTQIVYKNLDPVLFKDRRGHWTTRVYDDVGRLRAVEDALGQITTFDWCTCGSLAAIIDPLGRATSWLRDLQGRVTDKIYADGTSHHYAYETTTSRLKSVADAKQQTTSYQYFVDNNLKQVSYANAAVATPAVSFTYDTNYNRALTMTDGVGTTTYGYYAVTSGQLGAGKLQSVDGPWSNDTITYTYDELGRVKSRAINGVAQTASFDALGRVTVVTNALGSFTNEYVGVTGRIATNYYPNGQKTVFSYFANTNDQRLQTIWHKNSSAATISKFDYTYDADGQIATWTQQADAGTPNVLVPEYDPVDQLVAATVRSNSVTGTVLKQYVYGYDKAGNRTSEQIQSGAGVPPAISTATHNNVNQLTSRTNSGLLRFTGSLNEIGTVTVAGSPAPLDTRTTNFVGYAQASVGTNVVPVTATDYSNNCRTNNYQVIVTNGPVARTLTYDLNGNLISCVTATSTNTYEWDAVDRLTGITAGTNRTEFTYDGLGRRTQIVEKQHGSTVSTKKFLWCGSGLSEERDSTGGTVTKRFFGQGQINYQPSTINLFYTRDHLGSIREMTDSTGSIGARYDYDPYGRSTKVSGDLDADFAFTGHYSHSATGLYLTLYRAYDPDTGRWISRDPIEESGGLNLYAYVGNNPLNAVDPLGLISSLNAVAGMSAVDAAFLFGGWVATGAAAGGVAGALSAAVGELARQGGAFSGGCPDWSWDKFAGTVAHGGFSGMYWGALTGPFFGIVGDVAVPAYFATKYASAVATRAIRAGEVTTFQDFVDRSVVGDSLEGHELWQHANLKAQGLTTERLSTAASQSNPVMALDRALHQQVNAAQRAIDAAAQTPLQNINANAAILRNLNVAPQSTIDLFQQQAITHARSLGY